jgi:dihydrofolate reductase
VSPQTRTMIPIKIITAVSYTPVGRLGLGRENRIPWNSRKDLAHFRRTTMGTKDPAKRNMVLMGRRTWESLGAIPLPGRLNVVLSTSPKPSNEEVIWCSSFHAALEMAEQRADIETVWVIGGTRVYEEAFLNGRLKEVYLTLVHAIIECDTFFPNMPNFYQFKLADASVIEDNGLTISFNRFVKCESKGLLRI